MTAGNELNALISAYVDGERLDQSELLRVQDALASRKEMRKDAELQRATRALLRSRASSLRHQPPASMMASIQAALDETSATSNDRTSPSNTSWSFSGAIRSLFGTPRFATGLVALGSVVVLAAAALILLRSPSGSTADSEVTSVAYATFGNVLTGSFGIERESSSAAELQSFFASRGVEFSVFFPEVHASLRGGSVVTINGRQCAQLVYEAGEKKIYLLETDNDDITRGDIDLDRAVLEDVEQSRWHWEERADMGTMFVWKSNNVMCTAVSNMPTNEFSALFRLETL